MKGHRYFVLLFYQGSRWYESACHVIAGSVLTNLHFLGLECDVRPPDDNKPDRLRVCYQMHGLRAGTVGINSMGPLEPRAKAVLPVLTIQSRLALLAFQSTSFAVSECVSDMIHRANAA